MPSRARPYSAADDVPHHQELLREARRRFGIRQFRAGQNEIIDLVMQGRNVLGILPTAAGKSLCYQLPAMLLPHATVVVSPLISLMQDQQEKLAELDIQAVKLDSTLSAAEQRHAVDDVQQGCRELIYVTPERLTNPEYLDLLKSSGVSLLVVDEAHCVSQWGHDFRPAYLAVRNVIAALGNPPVLAVTATATVQVADDIIRQLGIKDTAVVRASIDRPGLAFEVHRTVNDEAKRNVIKALIKEATGTGIVYAATIRAAEELCQWLQSEGVAAERYHGKLRVADRAQIQQGFMANEYRVIVATKAFGLGIDKPDIRFVVHYQFPDSIESYYQEAGRGGRDGQGARAVLCYRLEDKRIQSYFLGAKYPSRQDCWLVFQSVLAASGDSTHFWGKKPGAAGATLRSIKEATGLPEKKVQVIVAHLEASGIVTRGRRISLSRTFATPEELEAYLGAYEERFADDRQRLDQIMHYAQSAECRLVFLRRYFDEPAGEPCAACDNCRALPTSNQFLRPAAEAS